MGLPALAALAIAALVVAYSAVVPLFEAPDEPGHYGYVQRLLAGQGLPVQGKDGDYDPELSQPPLYYAFEAAVARALPGGAPTAPPFSAINLFQNRTASGNVNLYAHTADEAWPWAGEVLRLHAMRLANLVFVAITLAATYAIAREAGLTKLMATAAAAALGLVPQFDFISGALNADNAVTAAGSVSLWLLLRWLNRPASASTSAWLGLAAGAAMLSKLSGLAVLPLAVGWMSVRAWRERSSRAIRQALLTAIIAVGVGGWWYVRNQTLYGDFLGWQPMLRAIGAMQRPQPLTALQALKTLIQQRRTAIGMFGWNNLPLPEPVYLAADALVALAAVGLVLLIARSSAERQWKYVRPVHLAVLASWSIVFAASLVRWVQVNADAAQWRLLLPAFPALAVLGIIGLTRLTRAAASALPLALACVSAASLTTVIAPAYRPDAPYAGSIPHVVHIPFGPALELVGFGDPRLQAGQATLDLFWRASAPLPEDDVIDVAATDAAGLAGPNESTWPQEGRAPTSTWQSGEVVRDRHVLTAPQEAGVWNLFLDVHRPLPGAPRLAVAGGGTTANVGRFLVSPPSRATPAGSGAQFANNLTLVDHKVQAGDAGLAVTLTWLVRGSVDRDYTVFVHVLGDDGSVVGQNDSQPDEGRFPTSLLPAGAIVDDRHIVNGASAGSQIEVGLYDAATGQRVPLAASAADAVRFPTD